MFVKRYEADELADKLSESIANNKKFLKLNPEQRDSLNNLSKDLRKFSGEYLNVRAVQFARLSADLKNKLSKSKPIINENLLILSPLINKVQKEIENLQTPKPYILNMDTINYRIKLIRNYLERNLVLQAILLLREVFVDYLILKVGNTKEWLRSRHRKYISDIFNEPDGNNVDRNIAEKIKFLRNNSELGKIWEEIIKFRNNLAHCGVGGGAEKEDLSGLKKKIEELTKKFEDEIRKG
jgi:hypothetical protein